MWGCTNKVELNYHTTVLTDVSESGSFPHATPLKSSRLCSSLKWGRIAKVSLRLLESMNSLWQAFPTCQVTEPEICLCHPAAWSASAGSLLNSKVPGSLNGMSWSEKICVLFDSVGAPGITQTRGEERGGGAGGAVLFILRCSATSYRSPLSAENIIVLEKTLHTLHTYMAYSVCLCVRAGRESSVFSCEVPVVLSVKENHPGCDKRVRVFKKSTTFPHPSPSPSAFKRRCYQGCRRPGGL